LVTIIEQIMSRSRLHDIVSKYDLYPEARAVGDMDKAIETMRRNIHISFKKSWRGRRGSPPAFEVAFEGREPAQVRDVAAALANIFLDENLKIREAQATGTSQFLKRELERMRETLRQKEELVRQFREKYMGLLPEQMQNNYHLLAQQQQHLDSINTALQKTEDRKILLQSQLSGLTSLDAGTQPSGLLADATPASLEALRTQLKHLRSRYTAKHPDVIKLAGVIEDQERENQTAHPESVSQETNISAPPNENQRISRTRKEELSAELKLIDKEIQSLHEEKKDTTRLIKEYRHRIESGPVIEQKIVDLRRDYQMASDNYQALLQKKLQSDLAENLERTQKAEQFRIQDPASLPQYPVKPNIPKFLSMGFLLALVCGLGLAFGREYLDQTFWERKQLERVVQLPLLVSVPLIHTAGERRRNKLKMAGTVCALASMASTLLCALYFLWKKHPTLLS
jgi:polysaccharide chain length determinant protein (PEP-CTERM system associated)